MSEKGRCAGCGMPVKGAAYHPWASCRLFAANHDSRQVDANIEAVVAYGFRAAKAGVSVGEAMRSITWDRPQPPTKAKSKKRSVR